jgi:hypothetical protein
MKKIFSFLLLFCSFYIKGQSYPIQVVESLEPIGPGNNNALVVIVYENDLETVEKEWKNRVKNYKTEKTNLTHHSLFADNAEIHEMGMGTVDIYTNFAEKKDNKSVRMVVGFDLGGVFMNSSLHNDKFLAAKKIVYDFATQITKASIEKQLAEENKKLDKFLEKKDDLEKGKKNLLNRIEEDKEKIKKAEQDIAKNQENIKKNEKDQEEQQKKIDEQKKMVDEFRRRIESVK